MRDMNFHFEVCLLKKKKASFAGSHSNVSFFQYSPNTQRGRTKVILLGNCFSFPEYLFYDSRIIRI